MVDDSKFQEANLWSTPIRNLRLTIEGTQLEPVITQFLEELDAAGFRKLRPRFYLSTEWGVAFETIAIAIPFYLAHPRLVEAHKQRAGHVEGLSSADILRYLRHEMGHVVSYGYKLYDEAEWVERFGSITQPYVEDYRPAPFSRRYVRHLPGWYAQKHPDEDWAETFAVWMTPGSPWRVEYQEWPSALAKLDYCERRMAELRDTAPLVTKVELDEDVAEMGQTLEEWYRAQPQIQAEPPTGIEGALLAIFGDLQPQGSGRPAAELILRMQNEVSANIYRWTGHFPERTRLLLRYLADRARDLKLSYAEEREDAAVVALTTLVSALAMNFVHRGAYTP